MASSKVTKRLVAFLTLTSIAVTLAGCGGGGGSSVYSSTDPVLVPTATLTASAVSLHPGDVGTLSWTSTGATAKLVYDNGTSADAKPANLGQTSFTAGPAGSVLKVSLHACNGSVCGDSPVVTLTSLAALPVQYLASVTVNVSPPLPNPEITYRDKLGNVMPKTILTPENSSGRISELMQRDGILVATLDIDPNSQTILLTPVTGSIHTYHFSIYNPAGEPLLKVEDENLNLIGFKLSSDPLAKTKLVQLVLLASLASESYAISVPVSTEAAAILDGKP